MHTALVHEKKKKMSTDGVKEELRFMYVCINQSILPIFFASYVSVYPFVGHEEKFSMVLNITVTVFDTVFAFPICIIPLHLFHTLSRCTCSFRTGNSENCQFQRETQTGVQPLLVVSSRKEIVEASCCDGEAQSIQENSIFHNTKKGSASGF